MNKLKPYRKALKALKAECAQDFRFWEAVMQTLEPPKGRGRITSLPKFLWIKKDCVGSRRGTSLCCTPFGDIWAVEPLHASKKYAKYRLV